MAYAELAALRPRAGGEYVYLRAAYGNLAAFLTGWTSFVAGFSGAIAASSVFLAIYLDRFIPGAGDATPIFTIPLPWVPLVFSRQALVALATIVLMSWIHLRGVGPGRVMGNILATLKVLALLMFIALGLSFGAGSTANLNESGGAPVAATAWLLALIPVMFAYSGWNAASYIAEEIRDPGRNVPRALALGTIAVIAVYVLLNLLYLFVLPVGELAKVKGSVLDVIADRLLNQMAGNVMGLVSIISLAASISAMTFAGPRVYYAMARDGVFFRKLNYVHPRLGTPVPAIVLQAIWASLLILTGTFGTLFTYVSVIITLFSALTVGSVIVLRYKRPDLHRPYRLWGYPIVPILFIAAHLWIVWGSVTEKPFESLIGLFIVCLGIPAYLIWQNRLQKQ